MKRHFVILLSLLVLIIIGNAVLISRSANKQVLTAEPPPEYYYVTELYKFTIENEMSDLRDPYVYSGKDSQKKMELSCKIKKPALVFRFSGEECNNCIEFVIKELKRTFPDFAGNDRVILLVSGINERQKEDYYGKPVTNLYLDDLGLQFEKFSTPFLFILDNDKKCKMMFVPDKSFPELTKFYLETIKARFFDNMGGNK